MNGRVTELCDGEGKPGLAEKAPLPSARSHRPSIVQSIYWTYGTSPIVLIDSETLVLACLNNDNFEYQRGLMCRCCPKRRLIVAFSAETLPALDGVSAQFECKARELHPVAAALP